MILCWRDGSLLELGGKIFELIEASRIVFEVFPHLEDQVGIPLMELHLSRIREERHQSGVMA